MEPAGERMSLTEAYRAQAIKHGRARLWSWMAVGVFLTCFGIIGSVTVPENKRAIAILAVIGYSLNDTIVVYDRIRENLKKYRRMPMTELLDLSVNETLSRTIVTSLSVLITLVALLLLLKHLN